MLPLLIEQATVLVAAFALLAVPGAALVSLLRIRAALPDTLAVPAGALLGSLVACAATFVQLLLEQPVEIGVGVHLALSVLLVAGATWMRRRRAVALVPIARSWNRWTTAIVVVAAAFAWIVRGAVRLDGLYHVALSRKLVELAAPSFDNVNRFADGGPNPVYALPGWHAFVGWTSWITGSDPIIAWEIMPVLVVALGALAAGGLAHVLLETRRAAPLGALGWLLMRVLFARREVDGDAILYGAVPGQVAFELAMPVVLAAIAVALRTRDQQIRIASLVAAGAGIVATVIYHANYLPYVAIIGLGYAAWWIVDRRGSRNHDGPRLLVVGGWVAGTSVACMAVVLPLLARLENFGNAPEGDRIDYHLTETFGMAHVRGGHAYEMFGLPGLLALLAAPVLAWRLRRPGYAIVSGGLLALLCFSFVPQLFQLLRATGSLTLLLRINHAIGILLVVAFAALVLELAAWASSSGWTTRRRQAWGAALLAAMMAAGVLMGYDKFAPDAPGYIAWVALGAVFVVAAVRSRRMRGGAVGSDLGADEVDAWERTVGAVPRGVLVGTALVLTIGLALPVGAISIRRAVENMDEFPAASSGLAQGDLRCLGGPVLEAMQEIPGGSVVLSDPVASFRAMALAPAYVVGDYKVWNAATSDNRAEERLAAVNGFFDSSRSDEERLALLREQEVDYLLVDLGDGRWLDRRFLEAPSTEALETAWSRLDRFADVQTYDGGGTARLVLRNPDTFQELAVDERAVESAIPEANVDIDAPCHAYALWKVRA